MGLISVVAIFTVVLIISYLAITYSKREADSAGSPDDHGVGASRKGLTAGTRAADEKMS